MRQIKEKIKCLDCNKLVQWCSTRCISCNMKYRWKTGSIKLSMTNLHLVTFEQRSKAGKLGSASKWKGHIAQYLCRKRKGLWTGTHDPYLQQQKKRFRNQRYKARKRDASGTHSFNDWLLLKAMFKYMCLCCKRVEPDIKLTEDHIIPLSRGGSDSIENIQPLCVSCNTCKMTKTINYMQFKGGEIQA